MRRRPCGVRGCAGGVLLHTVPALSPCCLWGGGAGLSCRGEGTRSLMLQGWEPRIPLELSAQLCCAHLAWLPGAPHAALSLPLLSRTGEKTQLNNSWVEAKSA